MTRDPFSATPDDRQQRLLDLVADVFLREGKWPRWPWVNETLEREDLNAEVIVNSMPVEPFISYGFLGRLGPSGPAPSQEIQLRIAGLRHVESASERVRYFVKFVSKLGELRQTVYLDPFDEAEPSVTMSEVARAMEGSAPPNQVILSMMNLEPSTQRCQLSGDINGEWSLSLPPEIRRFAGVADVEDYLERTRVLLAGKPRAERQVFSPSPFTLPTALDYLDVVWQLKTREPLLGRPGLERSARLAFTVDSGEEANSALSALSEVMTTLRVPDTGRVGGHPLGRVERFLSTILPEESMDRVRASVSIFDAARRVRNERQHAGDEASKIAAYELLGLPYPVSDWAVAWSLIQAVVASAADALREEIHASGDS